MDGECEICGKSLIDVHWRFHMNNVCSDDCRIKLEVDAVFEKAQGKRLRKSPLIEENWDGCRDNANGILEGE